MGSINSASPLIIIALPSTRGSIRSFICFCCCLFVFCFFLSSLYCLWKTETLVLAWVWDVDSSVGVGGWLHDHLLFLRPDDKLPPFILLFYQNNNRGENKIKDFVRIIQKSLFNDLTSLTCTLRTCVCVWGGGSFFKAPCNWKSAIFWKEDNWFSYTRCWDPVVSPDTVFDLFLSPPSTSPPPLSGCNTWWPQEVKTHKSATLQTFKFTLWGGGLAA